MRRSGSFRNAAFMRQRRDLSCALCVRVRCVTGSWSLRTVREGHNQGAMRRHDSNGSCSTQLGSGWPVPAEGRGTDLAAGSSGGSVFMHRICDQATEFLVYGMVVFSPWAFGTTQAWAIWVMNTGGYILGALLLVKGLNRRITDRKSTRLN